MRRARFRGTLQHSVAWAVIGGVLVAFLAGSTAAATAKGPPETSPGEIRIVTVVKVLGIGWFERMEVGIRRFAARTGVDATMTGPSAASSQQQTAIIRRLIGERPDAITVVPNAPRALERILRQAREAGIKVVTHEASSTRNTDVDIEAFDNAAFGAHLMDNLARCMRGGGSYVALVGHLSAQSHVEWARAALRRARGRYPGIRRIGPPLETLENERVAYRTAKRLLARYPRLEGIETSSAISAAGVGRAIREAGRQRQTCVMGTSIPSIARDYLRDGSVDRIFFWDPAIAGEAQAALALRLVKGEPVGPGLNLGLRGYTKLARIPGSPHGLSGSGWIAVDKRNVAEYPF
jgi:simple sugar transport system substrate-binding protein